MLPNLKCNFLIPLLTEQFFFTYSTYKAPPNLQLSLSSKGGCATGEALGLKGEVQEKSAPSDPVGKKRGRTKTWSSLIHPLLTYTLLFTKLVQLREQWCFGNIETPFSLTYVPWGWASGYQSSFFCSMLVYGTGAHAGMQSPEAARKMSLGQRCSLPKAWAWWVRHLVVTEADGPADICGWSEEFSVYRDFETNV